MTEAMPDTRSMIDLAWEAFTVHEDIDLINTLTGFSRALQRLQQLLNKTTSGRSQNLATHPISMCWADHVASLTGLGHANPSVVSKARDWAYHTGNGVTDEELCMALNGCTITVTIDRPKAPPR